MRFAVGVFCVALAAASSSAVSAQETGLQLGLGGFHQGFLMGGNQAQAVSERLHGREFYSTFLGPVELSASIGGESGAVAVDATPAAKSRALSGRLQLGYGGFLGGLAYGFGEHGLRYDQQHTLSAGVRYSLKSFSFGPAFAVNWQEGTQSQPERVYMLELGASYSLAPGIDAMGTLQHSRSEHSRSGGASDKEGTTGLFGISLSF